MLRGGVLFWRFNLNFGGRKMEEPIKFENNLECLGKNRTGFVINALREESKQYVILNKATCRSIKEQSAESEANWTTGKYIQIFSMDKTNLEIWGNEHLGRKVKYCEICNP